MSDGSSQSYTAGLEPANIDERPFAALATRVECLKALDTGAAFDLVICGGGLTAAMTAHQLALEGIRVLVLESGYFGVRGVAMRNIFASTLARQPLDEVRRQVLGERATHLLALRLGAQVADERA